MSNRIQVADRSNWEFFLFLLIEITIKGKTYPLNDLPILAEEVFTRQKLVCPQNIQLMKTLSEACGHKTNAGSMEGTIQKTLQNMRDDGYVKFFGGGRYKLTRLGQTKFEQARYEAKQPKEQI